MSSGRGTELPYLQPINSIGKQFDEFIELIKNAKPRVGDAPLPDLHLEEISTL